MSLAGCPQIYSTKYPRIPGISWDVSRPDALRSPDTKYPKIPGIPLGCPWPGALRSTVLSIPGYLGYPGMSPGSDLQVVSYWLISSGVLQVGFVDFIHAAVI